MELSQQGVAYAWIAPPYLRCPQCGRESFGVLMICGDHYFRRCAECWFPPPDDLSSTSFPLPSLQKKVIYLDQFVVSNMMKALNPHTKAHQLGRVDAYWRQLFEKVYRLCQMQRIVCPASEFHNNESIVSEYYEQLRRMYQLLGHGITFKNHDTVQQLQIHENVTHWLRGDCDHEPRLDQQSVLHGSVNAWQDRLIISPKLNWRPEWIGQLRQARLTGQTALGEVFRRWQEEKDCSFVQRFEEECRSFGKVTIEIYLDYKQKMTEFQAGRANLSIEDFLPPASVITIHSIHAAMEDAGICKDDLWPTTLEYLSSPCLQKIPSLRISSLLYAAMARKAASGQRRPPGSGTMTDVQLISTVLPYCDAIFVDNEFARYLAEKDVRDRLGYDTKVFSSRSGKEFLSYLDEIENETPLSHIEKVNELYGIDWPKPYLSLYSE